MSTVLMKYLQVQNCVIAPAIATLVTFFANIGLNFIFIGLLGFKVCSAATLVLESRDVLSWLPLKLDLAPKDGLGFLQKPALVIETEIKGGITTAYPTPSFPLACLFWRYVVTHNKCRIPFPQRMALQHTCIRVGV